MSIRSDQTRSDQMRVRTGMLYCTLTMPLAHSYTTWVRPNLNWSTKSSTGMSIPCSLCNSPMRVASALIRDTPCVEEIRKRVEIIEG